MVDGIFISKVRYGLQLLGRVRVAKEDPECGDLKAIQLVLNKLLRLLNGTKVKDLVSTKSMLDKFGILSINQLNAQVKLLEIWKALNLEDYPLQIKQQSAPLTGMTTRADLKGKAIEIGRSNLTKSTSVSDSIRVWNLAPDSVTGAKSVSIAKKAIKDYVKNLPI